MMVSVMLLGGPAHGKRVTVKGTSTRHIVATRTAQAPTFPKDIGYDTPFASSPVKQQAYVPLRAVFESNVLEVWVPEGTRFRDAREMPGFMACARVVGHPITPLPADNLRREPPASTLTLGKLIEVKRQIEFNEEIEDAMISTHLFFKPHPKAEEEAKPRKRILRNINRQPEQE